MGFGFGFLFKIIITEQGVGLVWQRQSGTAADRNSPVLFELIEQEQEME